MTRSFLSVSMLAKKYPAFTQASIRWLLFRDDVFRKACVRKLGKKLIIDEEKFLKHIDQSNSTKENV